MEVIASLKRYYPDIILVWAGNGPMRENLDQYIYDKGLTENVNMLGNQRNVEEILACCDYFIMPSKREGAPLTLIEAQAAGLKCFASDRVPDIIDCGGVSFIELDKTADQWADEIHKIIEEGSKAEIDPELLSRFDINKTVQALEQLYDALTC